MHLIAANRLTIGAAIAFLGLSAHHLHVSMRPQPTQLSKTMRTLITATHDRPLQYSRDHAYWQEAPTPPPSPPSPRGRGLVEPYRPLGPLPPRTVRAVAWLGPHPVADGHLVDVAALAVPPYELAAYGLHASGLQALVHARVPTSTDRTETHVKMRHLHRKRAPLATSGRFRRPIRPETPQYAGVSPGRRSWQRATVAENRTEVQDPWRNRRPFPAKPSRSRGDTPAGEAAATASANAGAACSIVANTPPVTQNALCTSKANHIGKVGVSETNRNGLEGKRRSP